MPGRNAGPKVTTRIDAQRKIRRVLKAGHWRPGPGPELRPGLQRHGPEPRAHRQRHGGGGMPVVSPEPPARIRLGWAAS